MKADMGHHTQTTGIEGWGSSGSWSLVP